MLTLDFSFSDEWNSRVDQSHCHEIREEDIRYSVALGDIYLEVNGVTCNANWGWVPVLDFAIVLRDICDSLCNGDNVSGQYDFTENSECIMFHRVGENIKISTSYVECCEWVPFDEFRQKSIDFFCKAFQNAAIRFPLLGKSPDFLSYCKRT